MNIKSIESQGVRPSLDELEVFHHGGDKEEGEEDEAAEDKLIRLARMAKVVGEDQTFSKGDSVKVKTKKRDPSFLVFVVF